MNAQPVARELDDNEFERVLNEEYPDVNVCGITFCAGHALRELDPIAFDCAKADYEDTLDPEEWKCENCGQVFDNEDDAEACCQEEDENDNEEDK